MKRIQPQRIISFQVHLASLGISPLLGLHLLARVFLLYLHRLINFSATSSTVYKVGKDRLNRHHTVSFKKSFRLQMAQQKEILHLRVLSEVLLLREFITFSVGIRADPRANVRLPNSPQNMNSQLRPKSRNNESGATSAASGSLARTGYGILTILLQCLLNLR